MCSRAANGAACEPRCSKGPRLGYGIKRKWVHPEAANLHFCDELASTRCALLCAGVQVGGIDIEGVGSNIKLATPA